MITMFERREKIKTILIVFSGAIMIAHAARMMFQGIFKPDSYYPAPTPATIDFYFDWLTLLILGIIVFSYSLIQFFKNQKNRIEKRQELDIKFLQAT